MTMPGLIRSTTCYLGLMTVLTGLAYPLAITAVAQSAFPHQANGSPVVLEGAVIGSELIGQSFSGPGYFHPRPSAAGADGYDAMASGGSNLGVTTQSANQTITSRLQAVRIPGTRVPIDLVTASASGLDPHLSPEAALYQAGRVAAARQLRRERVEQLVRDHVEGPTAGLLGAPRVNVLRLNLALDAQTAD